MDSRLLYIGSNVLTFIDLYALEQELAVCMTTSLGTHITYKEYGQQTISGGVRLFLFVLYCLFIVPKSFWFLCVAMISATFCIACEVKQK